MKTLTKDEAIRLHRKLWSWIAEETEKQGRKVEKREYFKTMGVAEEDIPLDECYCCEFVSQLRQRKYKGYCLELCPLDWGAENDMGYKRVYDSIYPDTCKIGYGYFRQWLNTKSPEEAAELARIIAELPEKEESNID